MSTRNIKDAKDLTTGELIYFKSHAQATFMSDGRTVEEVVSEMSAVDTSNLATKDELAQKQDIIPDIDTIRNNAANYKGTVTSVKINGTNKNPSNGVVDLGTVITSHQNISGKQDKLVSGTNIKTINGKSILGSGDITITSSGGAYPEVNHGTGDTTFTLTPNTFHVWDEVTSLTLNFGNETSGVANEYLFQFTSGSTATSLTLPDDIKWANNSTPTIVRKKIYQVSVLNGLASILEFSDTFNVNNYLTIEALEDNLTATFTNDVEYAIDGDEWVKLASGSETQPINVGQTLSFRGEFTPSPSNGIGTFTINKKCNLKGNCMSMLFGDNAADNYSLSGKDYAFSNLFNNCKNIVNISSNFLPATTVVNGCYKYMFKDCTSLTTAPELPARTLAWNCYQSMFNGCTSLTTAPKLPATTLANYCYSFMFYGCTSLTTAPELPATTLANYCYQSMFKDCTSLTTAPELPARTLELDCYQSMFQGCTSLTTASKLPATKLANYCYNAMFNGCTSLTTAPELPATTLATYCYAAMFSGCSSLTTAPKLPATTLANYCYSFMFYGCTSLTTAPELPATTLANYCYQSMFKDCRNLNYIKCLATSIPATNCTSNWVSGVSSTGTFVKASSMTSWTTGINGIPSGWRVQNA